MSKTVGTSEKHKKYTPRLDCVHRKFHLVVEEEGLDRD